MQKLRSIGYRIFQPGVRDIITAGYKRYETGNGIEYNDDVEETRKLFQENIFDNTK